jgi:hypothetical protein
MNVKDNAFRLCMVLLLSVNIQFCYSGQNIASDSSGVDVKPQIDPVIDIPHTGQKYCYDARGAVISCNGTGQDGDVRSGIGLPSGRFSKNDDDTITDNLTGLMWDINAQRYDRRIWRLAISAVESHNNSGTTPGGYSDWRIPNIRELRSLISWSASDPVTWLQEQGFLVGNDQDDFSYWTSTTVAENNAKSWKIDVSANCIEQQYKSIDTGGFIWTVRSVTPSDGIILLPRSGQGISFLAGDDGDVLSGALWPDERFIDNENETITDLLTGLIWMRNPPEEEVSWSEALRYANELDFGGHRDWRLPNANEIESLINYGAPDDGAWLYTAGFADTLSGWFWTSTSYNLDPVDAYIVNMDNGGMFMDYKANSYHVIPVCSAR